MDDRDAAPGPCSRCLGTGFELRIGSDGVERAIRCVCRDPSRETRLLESARVPRRYEHCTLDHFERHHDSQGTAVVVARRFVKEYPQGETGLLFSGPCGTGKTHLAVGILKALIAERGARCLFYDFQDLLKEIQSSYSAVSQASEMEILQPVFDAEVLVLDDLGAQKPTAWARDTVAHVINNRYNDRRVTLFTTNRPDPTEAGGGRVGKELSEPTLLDQIGERIHSRIYEMCHVVRLDGPDYRRKWKQPGVRSRMEGPTIPPRRA